MWVLEYSIYGTLVPVQHFGLWRMGSLHFLALSLVMPVANSELSSQTRIPHLMAGYHSDQLEISVCTKSENIFRVLNTVLFLYVYLPSECQCCRTGHVNFIVGFTPFNL